MSYVNLTNSLVTPSEKYIQRNYVKPNDANFLKKHLLSRGGSLVLIPLSAISTIGDTIIGCGAGLATIATAGKHKPIKKFASNHLESSRLIVAKPYKHLLRAINPEAKIFELPNIDENILGYKTDVFTEHTDGIFSRHVIQALKEKAHSFYTSGNFLKRHIAARLTYVLLAISCVVSRIADGIIGLVVVPLSLVTFGKVETINTMAFRALQAPGVVKDLVFCAIKFVNPKTKGGYRKIN